MHVLDVWLLSKTEKKKKKKKKGLVFYFSYPFLSFSLFLMAVLISVFIERTFGFVTHPLR